MVMLSFPKILTILLLCSMCVVINAGTVHRWTDSHGVTHFSDTVPASAPIGISTLELDNNYPPLSDGVSNYYSIANQWARMRKEREAKNELSLVKDRLRTERAAALASAEQPVNEPASSNYYPIYGNSRRDRRNVGFSDPSFGDAHRNTRRSQHHVQANHGRLRNSFRAPNRPVASRGGRSRGGYGAGLNFNINLR
jgi:hypothetical protein